MRHVLLLFALAFAACASAPAANAGEETEVYRAFLESWLGPSDAVVNLSDRTIASQLGSSEITACAGGAAFDDIGGLGRADVPIDQAIASSQVRLVNRAQQEREVRGNDPEAAIMRGEDVDSAVDHGFAAGLMEFSGVIFDRDRSHALFEYSFVCGRLCGSGGAVIMERGSDGKWTRSSRNCGGWIL